MTLKGRCEPEDGEACNEEKYKSALGPDTKMTRLQIASLLFDHIPSYCCVRYSNHSFNSTKYTPGSGAKKRVTVKMTLNRDQYVKVFGRLGKAKDLIRLSEPVDDGACRFHLSRVAFDLFCQQMKGSHGAKRELLELKWNQLDDETKKVGMESQRDGVAVRREANGDQEGVQSSDGGREQEEEGWSCIFSFRLRNRYFLCMKRERFVICKGLKRSWDLSL